MLEEELVEPKEVVEVVAGEDKQLVVMKNLTERVFPKT